MPNEIQTEGSQGSVNIDAGSDSPLGSDTSNQNTESQNTEGSNQNTESQSNELTPEAINNGEWRNLIPEQFATDASLKDIKTLENLVKSYINAQKMIGGEKVALPKKDWSEDDWNNFYSKLGRPESQDNYDLELEDIPEGMQRNEEYENKFKEFAYKNGFTADQTKSLWNFLASNSIDTYKEVMQNENQRLQEGWNNLKKDWGKAYNEKIGIAKKVAALGGQEFIDLIKSKGLSRDPAFVKWAAKFGSMVSEDNLGADGAKTKSDVMTPREAKSKINSIIGDRNHPYHNKNDARYQEARKEMEELYKFAYPEV